MINQEPWRVSTNFGLDSAFIAWYLRFDTDVFQSESHSAAGSVALRMCACSIVDEIVEDALQDPFKVTKAAERGSQQLGQDMIGVSGEKAEKCLKLLGIQE
ncbi:MAG: hypothetical protein ACE5HD_01610, partial [Acidobacteriota bacterium]